MKGQEIRKEKYYSNFKTIVKAYLDMANLDFSKIDLIMENVGVLLYMREEMKKDIFEEA